MRDSRYSDKLALKFLVGTLILIGLVYLWVSNPTEVSDIEIVVKKHSEITK